MGFLKYIYCGFLLFILCFSPIAIFFHFVLLVILAQLQVPKIFTVMSAMVIHICYFAVCVYCVIKDRFLNFKKKVQIFILV